MPNSISDTNPASGFVRCSQSSEENFVNCALSLDRILLSCTGGRLRGGLDFSSKPFYHGFRPHPLLNSGKLLIFRGLGYRSFRFWGNSWNFYAGGAGTGARQYRNQRQPWPAGWEGDPWKRGRSSRQRSNGFAQTLSVFFLFLGGLRGPVAPVAGARGLLILVAALLAPFAFWQKDQAVSALLKAEKARAAEAMQRDRADASAAIAEHERVQAEHR